MTGAFVFVCTLPRGEHHTEEEDTKRKMTMMLPMIMMIMTMITMMIINTKKCILHGSWPSRAEANMTRAPVSIEPLQLPKVLRASECLGLQIPKGLD